MKNVSSSWLKRSVQRWLIAFIISQDFLDDAVSAFWSVRESIKYRGRQTEILMLASLWASMEVSSVHKFLFFLQLLLSLLPLLTCSHGSDPSPFPPNFLFGTASSAYQVIIFAGKGIYRNAKFIFMLELNYTHILLDLISMKVHI